MTKYNQSTRAYFSIQRATRIAVLTGVAAILICMAAVVTSNISAGVHDWIFKILPSFLYLLALLSGLAVLAGQFSRRQYRDHATALHLLHKIRFIYLISGILLIFITVLGAVGSGWQATEVFDCRDHTCIIRTLEHVNLIKTTFTIEAMTAWFLSIEVKVVLHYCSSHIKHLK